jgi:hypothetical protein
VIEIKYVSMSGGWCSTEVVGTFGVSVWKHIRRGWDNFSKLVRFQVVLGLMYGFGMTYGAGIVR